MHLHRYRRPKILLEHAIDGRERPGGPAPFTAKLWLVKDQSRLDGLRATAKFLTGNFVDHQKTRGRRNLEHIRASEGHEWAFRRTSRGGGLVRVEKRMYEPATQSFGRSRFRGRHQKFDNHPRDQFQFRHDGVHGFIRVAHLAITGAAITHSDYVFFPMCRSSFRPKSCPCPIAPSVASLLS